MTIQAIPSNFPSDEFLAELSKNLDSTGLFDYQDIKRLDAIAVEAEEWETDNEFLGELEELNNDYDKLLVEAREANSKVDSYVQLVYEIGGLFPEDSPYIAEIQKLIDNNGLGGKE